MVKVELLINGERHNATPEVELNRDFSKKSNLINWADVKILKRRVDNAQVEQTISDVFEFCGKAADMIRKEYYERGFEGQGEIIVSRTTYPESNAFGWDVIYVGKIRFSSFSDDTIRVSVMTNHDTVVNKIKAKKSTTYDIPVRSTSQEQGVWAGDILNYDHIAILRFADWIPYGNVEQEETGRYSFLFSSWGQLQPPSTTGTIPMAVGNTNNIEEETAEVSDITPNNRSFVNGYIFTAKNEGDFQFDIRFKIKPTYEEDPVYLEPYEFYYYKIKLTRKPVEGDEIDLVWLRIGGEDIVNEVEKEFRFAQSRKLLQGDRIAIKIETNVSIFEYRYAKFDIFDVESLMIGHRYRETRIDKIDLVHPQDLLTGLVKRMAGYNVVCRILGDHMAGVMIAAAESIRGIEGAKIHTSFNKFNDWMNANGYAFRLETNNGAEEIVFDQIATFYDSGTVTRLKEVNELNIEAMDGYAYSAVEIGYEKYEYDEINGRDEFNTKSTFNTALIELDSVKKIISPYRADCYGVEFLSRERDGSKDKRSDNDVFVFDTVIQTDGHVLNRSSYPVTGEGMFAPDTLFNGKFSPRNLLMRNLPYIGAAFTKLTFTATEAAVIATINGIPENMEAVVLNPLFRPELWSFKTIGKSSDYPLYGLLEFTYKGKTYRGFINNILETFSPRTVDFELMGKSIS